jgi:hypothetical protein
MLLKLEGDFGTRHGIASMNDGCGLQVQVDLIIQAWRENFIRPKHQKSNGELFRFRFSSSSPHY